MASKKSTPSSAPAAAPKSTDGAAAPVVKTRPAARSRAKASAAPAPAPAAPAVPVKAPVTAPVAKVDKKAKASVAAPKAPKGPKEKLVRDSFTMPRSDFALIEQLKARSLGFQRHTKKSELLRAGLQVLAGLSDARLKAALEALVPLKAGRPKKDA